MVRSVLVVDDDRSLCALVAEVLIDEGYEVRCAANGLEALAAVERDPPDLVVSDLAMPGLGGAELAARLRARGIPVVLVSAADRGVNVPGVPLVPKPFDLNHLLRVVARSLDRNAA